MTRRLWLADYNFAFKRILRRLNRVPIDEEQESEFYKTWVCTRYCYVWVLVPWTLQLDYVYHKDMPKRHYVNKNWELLGDFQYEE